MNSYKKNYRNLHADPASPLKTAISLHQIKFLTILLQNSPSPIQEDLLSNKCTDEEAFLVLEYIPVLNLTSKSIEFLAMNANYEPLKQVLESRHDLKINQTTLNYTKSDEILIFLLSKVPSITTENLRRYFLDERYRIIDHIIESDLVIKNDDHEFHLLDSFLWPIHKNVALHIVNKYFLRLSPKNLQNLVEHDCVQAVEKMFEKNLRLVVAPKIWSQIKSIQMCRVLFLNSRLVINDQIISNFIKRKIPLNVILMKYPNYKFKTVFLKDAIVANNVEAINMFLEQNVDLDESCLKASLNNETVAWTVIDYALDKNPTLFNKLTLEEIPYSCGHDLFITLIHLFPSVNVGKIFNYFEYLKDDIVFENCKHLIDKNFLIPPECALKMLYKGKLRTFYLLMEHNKQYPIIKIEWIPRDQIVQRALIPYLENGRVILTPDYANFETNDLAFFVAAFKPHESESWYPIFKEKSRYFLEVFNFQSSIVFTSKTKERNPTKFVSGIFNDASKSKMDPVRYALNLLVTSSPSHSIDKIWEVLLHAQTDDLIKKVIDRISSITYYNVLDFRGELFAGLYRQVHALSKENMEDERGIALSVFKLSVLFSDQQKALDYLEYYRKKHPFSRQYIHDACLFNIPRKGDWDKELWAAKLIQMKYSPKIMNLLPYAAIIEKFVYAGLPSRREALMACGQDAKDDVIRKYYMKVLSKLAPAEWPSHRLPNKVRRVQLWDYCAKHLKSDVEAFIDRKKASSKKGAGLQAHSINDKPFPELLQFIIRRRDISNYTDKELQKISLNVVYAEIDKKNIPFAAKCLAHGFSREDFNKIIQYDEKPKIGDMLPEVLVEDDAYPHYRLIKMSPQDPRLYILGKLTNCCQSIGDLGGKPALHGGQSPFGGFYVLIKKDPQGEELVVAQAWSGITDKGEIVFDSVEYNLSYPSRLIERFFLKAAQQIVQTYPTIRRVVVGGGGNTPDGLKNNTFLSFPYSKMIGYSDIGYDSISSRFVLAESQELPDDFKIDNNFVVTTGIDTYARYGQKTTILVLNALDRMQFWKNHSKTYELLRKNELNPLVEEGYFKGTRDRQGEFFLTAEALDKLVNHFLPCNSVIFNENDLVNLGMQLRALDRGKSSSLAIIDGAHSVAVYIKNVEGEFKAFIMDSEGDAFKNFKLIMALESTYPQIKIIATKAGLQTDYSNSGVFMLQALRFFAKEGDLLFERIDLPSRLDGSWPHFNLKNAYIPPGLLKTLACSILDNTDEISQEALNTIVSPRKQINLRVYLAKNSLTKGKRKFSKAAIQKKYRFFDLLEKLI